MARWRRVRAEAGRASGQTAKSAALLWPRSSPPVPEGRGGPQEDAAQVCSPGRELVRVHHSDCLTLTSELRNQSDRNHQSIIP